MGTIGEHLPVKLFCGITYCQNVNLNDIYKELENLFSPIELESNKYTFSQFTDYYSKEMGENLMKLFLVFTDLQMPEDLPDIKKTTNQLEENYLVENMRTVNLDPGYISEAKLVLATTKNYSHRIYLGKGIFGDIHLQFTNGSFQSQSWTYPDYQQPQIRDFFKKIRERYFEQLGEESY